LLIQYNKNENMRLLSVAILAFFCLFTSCALNGEFLKPDKIPADREHAYLRNASGDTLTIMQFGPHHQPTFTNKDHTPVVLDYTIESVELDNKTKSHKITGWFLKPTTNRPTITLLLLHGNDGNILTEYLAAATLAKHGMQVFVIDYSGYGFSEGKATWRNVYNDAGTALQYLHSREDVHGTKLAIYGQSYGGYTAVSVAKKYAQLTDGLITEGAFTNRKAIGAKFSGLGIIAKAAISEHHSAVKAIARYHKPVLIIQSDEDEAIPVSMAQKLYRHANAPKEIYMIHKPHIAGLLYYPDSISAHINRLLQP